MNWKNPVVIVLESHIDGNTIGKNDDETDICVKDVKY